MSVSAPTPVVPVDWEIAKTGEVCEVQNGYAFKSEFFNDKNDGLPLIRIRDVHSGKSDTFYSGPFDEKYVVTDDDLLIGMDGEFRVRKWKSGKGLLNQRVCRLLPNGEPMTADFLYYSIGRPLKQIEDFTPFTTVKHISAGQIRAIELPLPPLPEQKKIAHILSTVQRAIEAQERIIHTTTELKKALMHKLFTEGLRHEPQKQTEIGPVPESWKVVELGEIARIERGKFSHRPRNEPCFYGGKYPFVQTGDVSNCDGYIRSYTQTLNEAGIAISKMFPVGTILITIAANIGFTGILEFDSACPDSLIGITPNENVHNEFLNYYLITQQPEMDRLAPKGTQKNINIQFLKPWPVPLPSFEEQREIAEAFSATDRKIRLATQKRSQIQDLFRTLLHELMTAKTRVRDVDLNTATIHKQPEERNDL